LEVNQAESVIATLKEDLAASQAQCNSLKLRNEELEEQYSLLWSSTSHPSKVKGDSSASTSKGCDRCHHIDIESYATNLANMEAMKKEIARLNSIIARGCMGEENKKARFTKRKMLEKSKNPGFGYVEGGKTNERKIIKEKECIDFKSTGFLFAQTPEVPSSKPGGSGVWKPRATQTAKLGGSEKILGSSGVCKDKSKKKNKAQHQHVSKASNTCMQVQNHPIMPRRNLNPNKNKAHASRDIPPSYVLRRNNVGKVVATYVGNESNIYVKRSLWVPKVLVANVEGPKSNWGPKRRN
jgi:hypothetical protein